MTDPTYLNGYLRNLADSGAVLETPGGFLIAFTGWRESDPYQPGRWVSDRLEQEERFFGLLLSHHDRDADVTWLRIEPACVGMFAENVFGYGVHQRVQDLFDLIDSEWKRMHPQQHDDHQECNNCGEQVYTLSSRLWCDGCEEQAASTPQRHAAERRQEAP